MATRGFVARPVQLVRVVTEILEKEGKDEKKGGGQREHGSILELVPEGVEILKRFDTTGLKTEIISIAGEARHGKSGTLNFLLAHLNIPLTREAAGEFTGFVSRVDEKTVTQGIWFYGTPLRLPNGNQLLLLDTQGTGLGKEAINTQLVSLAFLLSNLVILNIDGALNEESKTLLMLVKNFLSRVDLGGASSTERANFFPTLLVRSKDYRLLDFHADFPEYKGVLPKLTDPLVCEVLDNKLDHDLSNLSEKTDKLLATVQRQICAAFPHRHWMFTFPPTLEDDRALDEGKIYNLLLPGASKTIDEKSFVGSMKSLMQRILLLSKPKQFSFEILLEFFSQALSSSRLHVPSILDILCAKQEEKNCLQALEVYKAYWTSPTFVEPETEEQLRSHHENAKGEAYRFFSSIEGRNTTSQLDILLTAHFLPHQEKFKTKMFAKIDELKRFAIIDERKRELIAIDLKKLMEQVDDISKQISSFQVEVEKNKKILAEAQAERERTQVFVNSLLSNTTTSQKNNGCVIL